MRRAESENPVFFLVNPCAGNGSTGNSWPEIASYARERLGDFEAHLTSGPLDAREKAGLAVRRGARKIICVGGDGTLNEVINGVMGHSEAMGSEVTVGFIPNGTGCDLAKTVPVPRDVKEAVRVVSEGISMKLDLGRIRHRDHNGVDQVRYFHNIASLGLGGEVVRRVNRTSKRFGPFFSFIWATLITLVTYEKKNVTFRVDGSPPVDSTIWHVAVANGQFQGGGMWVAPAASVDDGFLDITVVGDLTLPQVFMNLHNLYNGKIYKVKEVTSFRGRFMEAFSGSEVFLDVDGEEPGTLPVKVELIPRAINMFVDRRA